MTDKEIQYRQFKQKDTDPEKVGKIQPRTLSDEEVKEKLLSDDMDDIEEGLRQLKIDPETQEQKSVLDDIIEQEGLKPMEPSRPPSYTDSPSGPLVVVDGAWIVMCGNCDLRYSHYHDQNRQYRQKGYRFSRCSHCGTLNRIQDTT